jgi:UDP-3-O-[3-hydroxymyristoyl] glucosamine N-acyltransferase
MSGANVAPSARLAAGVSLAAGAVIHAAVAIGAGSVIGSNTVIHQGVDLGAGCTVGSGTVIHAGTRIGAGCTIEDCVVLGKRPQLRPGSSAAGGELEPLQLGDQVTVCAGAVVYAGVRVGRGTIIGDQSQVRERALVGADTVVGRGSCVDFAAVVGDRVLIQTGVYLTAGAIVEDDVFLGPGVQTTNDDAMGRLPRGQPLAGPVLRRACRIGGAAVLTPGVEIGEEAFVAAGAVVTRDVGPREVVVGVPARVIRRVGDEDLIERWR